MTISLASSAAVQTRWRGLMPLCVGAGTYLLVLLAGDGLLNDADTLWQITVGQWIFDHHAVPHTDVYSLTRFGAPWISTSWLSQVLFAAVHAQWGWAGPVVLTSLATAAAVAILFHLLAAHLELPRALLLTLLALMLAAPHLLARPHALAMPVMVAWTGALMAAAEERKAPSFLLLPLMALWSNLHGGFVLGLALIGPIALEALWCAAPRRRIALGLRWTGFAIGALAASCVTPYGWHTLSGAASILALGDSFKVIAEWRPADFSSFDVFAATLLGLVGFAFYRGLVLSPPRILLLLGLLWMALAHVRGIDAFGFIVPLLLAQPLSRRPGEASTTMAGDDEAGASSHLTALAALAIAAAACASTVLHVTHHHFAFAAKQTPTAAVDLLIKSRAQRIFNSYDFGGYLIARDVKPFVDGRTELYGETFMMDFVAAHDARDVDGLLHMLDRYRIDATLLRAGTPAAQVLDHIQGWKRLYADETAVVHVRTGGQAMDAATARATSN